MSNAYTVYNMQRANDIARKERSKEWEKMTNKCFNI